MTKSEGILNIMDVRAQQAVFGLGSANFAPSTFASLILFGLVVPTFLAIGFYKCIVVRKNRLLPRILLGFVVLIQVSSCIAAFLAMAIANWLTPRSVVNSDALANANTASYAAQYQLKDTITTSLKSLCYRVSDKMPFLTQQCEPLCSFEPFVSRFSMRTIVSSRGGCGLLHLGGGLIAFGIVLGLALVAALFIRSDTLSEFLQYFSSPDDTDRLGYFGRKLRSDSREGRILRRKLVAQAHVWLASTTSVILFVGLGFVTRWNQNHLGFTFDTSYILGIVTLATQILALGVYATRYDVLPSSLSEWVNLKSNSLEDDINDDLTEEELDDEEEDDNAITKESKSSKPSKNSKGKGGKHITTDEIIDLDLDDSIPRRTRSGILHVSDEDSDENVQQASPRNNGNDSDESDDTNGPDEEGFTTDFEDDFYSSYRKTGQGALDTSASLAFAISKALGIDEEESDMTVNEHESSSRSKKGKKKGSKKKLKQNGKKKGDAAQPRRGSFLKANATESEIEDSAPASVHPPPPIQLSRTNVLAAEKQQQQKFDVLQLHATVPEATEDEEFFELE